MSEIVVYDKPSGGEPLRFNESHRVASGGEGAVYVVSVNNGKKIAIKVFKEQQLKKYRHLEQKIADMVEFGRKNGGELVNFRGIAWPQISAYNKSGKFVGYGMRYVEGKKLTDMANLKAYRNKKHFPDMDREKLSKMLIDVWKSVKFLHERGIYIGDVNLNNVLCSENYEICWIDVDSFQIRKLSTSGVWPCLVGHPEMIPPEHLQKDLGKVKRSHESDCFSLAVLSFKCLMLGRHPYDHIGVGSVIEKMQKAHFPYVNNQQLNSNGGIPKGPWEIMWSHYTPSLQRFFVRALDNGASGISKRPSVDEWVDELAAYIKELNSAYPIRTAKGDDFWYTRDMEPTKKIPNLTSSTRTPMPNYSKKPRSKTMTNSDSANNDLIENTSPRCPCMLVLDVSSSMQGASIAKLNEGVRQFLHDVGEDEFACESVEIGVITYGGRVSRHISFCPPDNIQWTDLKAVGNTPMGEAVNAAIEDLEARKKDYKEAGISYYQPWLVIMTDGKPTDRYANTARRLREMAEDRKAVVFGIGIGDFDMGQLAEFCPEDRPPARLDGLKFKEFFAWLSQSMSCVSQSNLGDQVDLPKIGWSSVKT